MAHASSRDWRKALPFGCFLAATLLLLLNAGCGSGSSPAPPTGGETGTGGSSFQPRPFPGDYFLRLPTQDGGGLVSGAVYDSALQEVFVSDPDVNAVEVYSSANGQRVGEIPVPGPVGLSLSPDLSQLIIGTITPYVYIANPTTLHLVGQIQVPASQLAAGPSAVTLMPVAAYSMADGSVFLGMGIAPEPSSSAYVGVEHLVRYDPANGTFTPEDPGPSGISAIPSRSFDGQYLLTCGLTNSGYELFLYSTAMQGYAASSAPFQNICNYVAVNADDSQFASVEFVVAPGTGSFNSQINFWGPNLQAQTQYTVTAMAAGAIFSRDGKYFYVNNDSGVLVALNTQTGAPAGYLGVSVENFSLSSLFDVDETNHLFAALGGGLTILNAAQLQASEPAALPEFVGATSDANPSVGPVAGGTQVQFVPAPSGSGSADGIVSSMEAYFGSAPAPQDVVAPYPSSSNGENFLTATAPPATNPGPISVVLTDANNDAVFLPDAYTYGPHLLRVQPSVASPQGGDQITVSAYGLGFFDLSDIHVTIGGSPARASSLDSISNGLYPEQTVTVQAPPGTPGWADITLTTSNGSDTLKRGVQYLKQEANLQGGPYAFAVYDSLRDHFYVTGNGNSVAVFDPGSLTLLQPLQSSAISSGAVLQSEALTPDNSELLVADPSDQVVVIFDLQDGTSTAVSALLPSDGPVTLTAPMPVVAAAGGRAFVSLTPCVPNPVREIDLTGLTVQARPDASSTCPDLGGASADGSTIIFAGNSGAEPPGPESIWRYESSSDSFTGPVIIGDAPWVGGDGAADADGGVIALSQGVLDQRLLPLVPLIQSGLDSRLNETGSLLYSVNVSVLISDTRNGHELLLIGLPAGIGPYRPLAVDPLGDQILVATQGGLSYFQLGVVPLAVGTVSPAQAAVGTPVTIRGSGFVAGTTVTIAGQSAVCTEADSETLSCAVPNLPSGLASISLMNPDGQTISVEAALTVQ